MYVCKYVSKGDIVERETERRRDGERGGGEKREGGREI